MEKETIFGYARVSTKEQNEDRQVITLHNEGVEDRYIYIDKQSGKDFNRPQYQKMVRKMKANDLLVVDSIDRLGRNYEDIREQWRYLTKDKHINIRVVKMPLLDTRGSHDLVGTFISDLVLQILSFVAENERTNIRQRQAEGIAAAKAAGKRFGRPEKEVPSIFFEVVNLWIDGKITERDAAKMCDMSPSTFWYKADKYRKSHMTDSPEK